MDVNFWRLLATYLWFVYMYITYICLAELFVKIVNREKPLFSQRNHIIDVWESAKYASGNLSTTHDYLKWQCLTLRKIGQKTGLLWPVSTIPYSGIFYKVLPILKFQEISFSLRNIIFMWYLIGIIASFHWFKYIWGNIADIRVRFNTPKPSSVIPKTLA